MNPQSPDVDDLQTRIIGRATTDPQFRRHLLADPRATIEGELGIKLPPDLEIQVVEETATRLCLVLPMPQDSLHGMSEADLSGIAGGGPHYSAGHEPAFVLNAETGALSFGDGASGRRPPEAVPISATYRSRR